MRYLLYSRLYYKANSELNQRQVKELTRMFFRTVVNFLNKDQQFCLFESSCTVVY